MVNDTFLKIPTHKKKLKRKSFLMYFLKDLFKQNQLLVTNYYCKTFISQRC